MTLGKSETTMEQTVIFLKNIIDKAVYQVYNVDRAAGKWSKNYE